MFKNFLVPLDGSAMAESVLPAVAQLSALLKTRVILIHVIEKDAPQKIHGDRHLTDSTQAQIYLDRITTSAFSPDLKVESHVHTAEIKNVAESIVNHLSEFGNDLIIMCSHGHSGTRDLLFGSIAQQVVALGTVPVLLFPSARKHYPQVSKWQRILVPLNEDPQHAQGLNLAVSLARIFRASLQLLMVIPTFGKLSGGWVTTRRFLPSTTDRMLDEIEDEGFQYLKKYRDNLEQQGLSVNINVLRGEPVEVISQVTQQNNIDLLLLSTHGKVGTAAFWSGSIMPRICNKCNIPVLLVPVAQTLSNEK
jgi:nucleotide-binding universal stress UspA family protein